MHLKLSKRNKNTQKPELQNEREITEYQAVKMTSSHWQ